MNCPVCDVTLLISSREGIEIDHCPQCRGVWLDRGELDKIIERAAPAVAAPAVGSPPPRERERYDDERGYRDRDRDRDYREERRYGDDEHRRRKKKRSILEEIFDFD